MPIKFIKLTKGFSDGCAVWINPYKVEYVHKDEEDDLTVIGFSGGMEFVKESPETVIYLLKAGEENGAT